MNVCDHCEAPFEPTRRGHRFCHNRCRSAWHRDQHLPGRVTGIRPLKRGGWSVTVRYPFHLVGVQIGSAVTIQTADMPRQYASSDTPHEPGNHVDRHEPENATAAGGDK